MPNYPISVNKGLSEKSNGDKMIDLIDGLKRFLFFNCKFVRTFFLNLFKN